MMDSRYLLDKSEIYDFDKIIDVILNHGLAENVLAIEHIGDIILLLDKFDKIRALDNPELKLGVFTVINEIMNTDQVEIIPEWSWLPEIKKKEYTSRDELFSLLNDNWDKDDGHGLDRNYLLWFKKINC